ncbi:outer membrane beta-barrel protein [Mucilaginibacter arboris]|uniref:outer membrane beta-barrel protein n=1 Tax=Mucilaginibacter arboris TaxID=2682090 RepID=UPI0012FAF041
MPALYQNKGITGNAFANVGYKLDNGFRFGLDAGYFSGSVLLQGKSSHYIYTSYSASKELFNKKLTVAVAASNPYSKFFKFNSYTSTRIFISKASTRSDIATIVSA